MRYPKPYYDACKLQGRIMQVLDTLPTKELANVAKGYCTLETLKLRLRMKPAPKPVDVSDQQGKHKRKVAAAAGSFAET